MRWLPALAVSITAFTALSALPALAQEVVPVSRLDADPGRYAGRIVTVEGEIVGDYGIRSDAVWFQINDDPYVSEPLGGGGELVGGNVGIGVRVPRILFNGGWGPPGAYRVRGPVIRLTGTFRYNDPDAGGETFVDATGVELLEHSRPLPGPTPGALPASAGVLLIVAGGILYAWLLRRPGRTR